MSRLPIRVRVTAAFALAMAAVLAASGLFLYLRLGSHLSTALDRDLRLRAQDLAALVRQPHASLANDSGNGLVERGESYAELVDARGRVLEATRPLGSARLLRSRELRAALRGPVYADRPSVSGLDEPSRLLAVPVGRRVLVVGATRQDRAETLASFRDELLIAGPIALLLACGVGYLLAGASLRQVDSMRRRAAAISAETPGDRLPVPATGDEVQRLGETLNEMLDRLEGAIEREREFVADAAHELRTPLALLRTELELAARQARSAEELRAAVHAASEEAERLARLAEGLLLIARTDRGRLPLRLEDLDVDELLGAVATRFAWRTSVECQPADGLRVRGDRLRLEQALGNLVDNALRYGGGSVELAAHAEDGRIELHVRDDGSGFPQELLGRAFERFTRGDPARAGGGAGLGLSIVRAIAEAHGGSAHVANPAPKGADAWVTLPVG
ncbi:MAG TPA: ATP-binding protein [Gaiellaceae bacterium]